MPKKSLSLCGNPACSRKRTDGRGVDRITLFEASRPSSSEVCESASERQVRCTDCLVRLYNSTPDEDEKEAIARRLYTFGAAFRNLMPWEKAENAEEYARVANIEVRCLRDRELVYSVLNTLRKTLHDDMYAIAPIAKALSHVLVCLDVSVFEGNPSELLRLADSLARTLKRCRIAHNRQTFEQHRHTFVALYQACAVVHRIAPRLDASLSVKWHQDRLRKSVENFRDAPHYPYRFYRILILQSIHRLAEEEETSVLCNAVQRFMTGTTGVLYVYHFFRSLLSIDVDVASFSEGLQRLKAAYADDTLQRKPWFDWLQPLSSAAMLCLTDPEKFESFQSRLEEILEYQRNMRDREERKAVRYGIVNELTFVATMAESAEVRKKAMFELQYLATCLTLSEGWYEDPEVCEGLLDAASRVYQHGEFCPNMRALLKMLTRPARDHPLEIVRSRLVSEIQTFSLTTCCDAMHKGVVYAQYGQLVQMVHAQVQTLSSYGESCWTRRCQYCVRSTFGSYCAVWFSMWFSNRSTPLGADTTTIQYGIRSYKERILCDTLQRTRHTWRQISQQLLQIYLQSVGGLADVLRTLSSFAERTQLRNVWFFARIGSSRGQSVIHTSSRILRRWHDDRGQTTRLSVYRQTG